MGDIKRIYIWETLIGNIGRKHLCITRLMAFSIGTIVEFHIENKCNIVEVP